MSTEETERSGGGDDAPAEKSAFLGDTPPHLPGDEQQTDRSDEDLSTEDLGEGGPAGA